MNATAEILQKARDLISDEKNWTQDAFARDEHGLSVMATDKRAVCFCSRGALYNVTGGAWSGAYDHLLGLVSEDQDCLGLAHFNDTHTHAEVLDLFDRAIKRAISAEETK